jgi:hypothetical protein
MMAAQNMVAEERAKTPCPLNDVHHPELDHRQLAMRED